MEEWKTDKLSNLGITQTGSTPKTTVKENFGSAIPFVKPADFQPNGLIDYNNDGLSEKGLAESRLVMQDSVLMVCIGATIGKVGYTSVNVTTNQQINSFTPHQGILTKYCYYAMLNDAFQKQVIYSSSQATLPIINKSKWSSLEIKYPAEIKEQQLIVAILDQAFADIEKARANAEKNLKNARELSMASIRETFLSANNTELLTIDELADVITDYVANGSFAALAENVQYKSEKDYAILLRLVDHSKSYKNDFVYINQHAFTFLKKSVVVPNDIILSNVGARLGTVFRAPDLGMPMSLGPNSILIKSTEYGDYLYCWLQSAYGQSEIKSIVSGAGQPKFNKTQFKKLFVPVPKSVSERAEIVERIESITQMLEHLESIYSRKLTALEELKKSLLQKAFSGELTKTEGHAA